MINIHKNAILFSEQWRLAVKNFWFLRKEEQELVLAYSQQLIINPFVSFRKVAKWLGLADNGRKLANCLNKLWKNYQEVKEQLTGQLKNNLELRKRIYLAIDDYGLAKRGTKIATAGDFFAHAKKRHLNGHVVVDAAVIQDNRVCASYHEIQPLRRKRATKQSTTRGNGKKPLITKIALARRLINQLVPLIAPTTQLKKRLWVLMDRWYPCKQLVAVLRQWEVNYLLAIKSNAQVLLPDRKAMSKPHTSRRGRPAKYKPRKLAVRQYFDLYKTEHYFTFKPQALVVYYKDALLTTSSYGRVKIFAFRLDSTADYRYFICSNYQLPASEAFAIYSQRWPIEGLHKELKQYFGLRKCHSRRDSVVRGHFWLVYCLHQQFCQLRLRLAKKTSLQLTAHQLWYEQYQFYCWPHKPPLVS